MLISFLAEFLLIVNVKKVKVEFTVMDLTCINGRSMYVSTEQNSHFSFRKNKILTELITLFFYFKHQN